MASGSNKREHKWKFFRVGVDQIDLRTGADITSLEQLVWRLHWLDTLLPGDLQPKTPALSTTTAAATK